MRTQALTLVVLTALAAGCRLAPPPSQSQMLTDALPATTTIPSQWAVAVDTNTVADDWLETFDDPRLDLLVAEALENNPDLRAAAARVEAARQVVVVVGSQLLPKIGGRLGAAANRDEDHSDWGTPTTAYAGVSWEADIWGKLRAQKAAAEASFESVAYEYAWAQESLAATTAKAWFLATTTRQLLRLSARAVDIYSELFELVKVRRAAGKVSDLDVAEAGASLNTAQAQLRTAKRAEAETRRALELLLGRYPSAEIAVATDFPPVPPPVRAGLPLTLLERRPDLLAAQSQVLSAFRREEAARLALLPSFGLRVEGGRLDDSVLSLLRLNPWLFRARIGISIPIYAGGELRARVKIATAEQQAAVEGYGAAVLIAFNEVENALTNETLLAQTLHYREASVQDRSEAVRISRIQYKAGATDMLSVLQIQADQIAAEGAVIRARNAQLSNRIQLHLSLGGHW